MSEACGGRWPYGQSFVQVLHSIARTDTQAYVTILPHRLQVPLSTCGAALNL